MYTYYTQASQPGIQRANLVEPAKDQGPPDLSQGSAYTLHPMSQGSAYTLHPMPLAYSNQEVESSSAGCVAG